MNKATRVTAALVGIYAGLLGMAHGYFSTLQGSVRPGSLMFTAIGPPCQAEMVYHACFPALTIIPNLLISGILALIVSFAMIIWSIFFLPKRRGGLVMMVLSVLLLLVGGGFLPAFTGTIAGATGTRINGTLSWWQTHLSDSFLRLLSGLWPWSLAAYFVLVLGSGLLGSFINALLISLGMILLLVEYALLLLAVFSAFAHDIQHTKKG